MILKMYPFKNCHTEASWGTDGSLYADTITITSRKNEKGDKRDKKKEK